MSEHQAPGPKPISSEDAYEEHVATMKRHVQTATESIDRVIASEETLREDPKRRDTAEDRIIQAERERAILEAESDALDLGDVGTVADLHEEFMRRETAPDRPEG